MSVLWNGSAERNHTNADIVNASGQYLKECGYIL